MPVTFQVVGNLADFGDDVRAGVKVRATASPGIKVGDVAVHSNQPETVVTDETGAFTLELVSLPGVWYRIQTPYANAINTVNLAGYVPDVDDPTTGEAFPADTVIDLIDVVDEDPTPGYDGIAYTGSGGGGAVDSVNGETGVVVLTAADVGAATTAQGAKADTATQPADLTAGLATKANTSHAHVIADTTGLQAALDAKAATSHSHAAADVTSGTFAVGRLGTGTPAASTYVDGATGAWTALPGGGGGATDHGALTGLADDDHTQYALADGSRGSFATTAQGTLAGTASQPGHAHAGADITSGTVASARLPAASDTASGIVELATTAETTTGTDTTRAVTAAGVKAVADTKAATSHSHAGADITSGTVAYARLPVGTTASTVAAGDDSRVTGAAQKSANLSDLANAGTARTNLGLGTAATTAATAYATAAQGALADSALQATTAQTINAQTGTSYTLVSGDAGKVVTLSNAGAITLNAPGSTFTTGQRVDVVVIGAGMATVVGTSGATANGTPSLVSRAQWSAFTILWTSATTCVVIGDLA